MTMAPHFPEVRLPPNWFKKDAGQDITSALPKVQELGAFFSSYGGDAKTRCGSVGLHDGIGARRQCEGAEGVSTVRCWAWKNGVVLFCSGVA